MTNTVAPEHCCICGDQLNLGVFANLPDGSKAHEVCHLRRLVAKYEQVVPTRTIDKLCREYEVTPNERRQLVIYLVALRMAGALSRLAEEPAKAP